MNWAVTDTEWPKYVLNITNCTAIIDDLVTWWKTFSTVPNETEYDIPGNFSVHSNWPKLFFFFSFLSFVFLGPHPVAYGGSQARGQIGALAASLHHSHSNSGSEPSLWPTPQLRATLDPNPLIKARDRTCVLMDTSQFCQPLSHNRNSWLKLFFILHVKQS